MDKLTSQLNNIVSQWADVFDLLSQIRLVFSVNQHANLCLNNTRLCPAEQMVLDHVMYDPEEIVFFFEDSSEIRISITWPEEGAPFVSDINFASASDVANE